MSSFLSLTYPVYSSSNGPLHLYPYFLFNLKVIYLQSQAITFITVFDKADGGDT